MTEDFTMAVRFKAKPEHSAEFGERLNAVVDATRRDAGCIIFDVHAIADDPNGWFLYEGWRSKADSDAHMAKPEIKAFFADWERLLAEVPEPLILTLISQRAPPADAWAE
jgi:quinol monooxygenase YgiN